ncbi:chorismate synthase [Natranaerobius trueperi]|uniref:Chorismate synthase n=1 Tax=Natranaerobius trueperi TaxID=759412 RepID=A0A226BX78_9FIRM|nr:chorismate synthase [Natranaerobius trueperi]OWZ83606.1 chorismate synthase [Natranaerobius trueperi]
MSLRYLSGGESHGLALTAIIEGFWANVEINLEKINLDLKRRQSGYGRGGRMRIENDELKIISGLRQGLTLGSPITIQINNKDFQNWEKIMDPIFDHNLKENRIISRPRPGHVDLVGGLKYQHKDLRNVLERSSARGTAIRVAVGSICKQVLEEIGIKIISYVTQIGKKSITDNIKEDFEDIFNNAEQSEVRCPDLQTSNEIKGEIDKAGSKGETLGGVFEVVVLNSPPGLGSYVHFDRKLDAILSGALMSLQGIKGVEIGLGFEAANSYGSQVHDEIFYSETSGFYRERNNAGGIEGGVSNGEPIVLRCAMKPIPTLSHPLRSVDFISKEPFDAQIERSDVCAVPAASVVGESIIAFEIAKVLKEKFGGDSLDELKENVNSYLNYLEEV